MASPTASVELSVVIPCLNEARSLAACLDEAQAALARAGIAGEVIVADNGSTDGSPAIATAHGARVVAVTERGYGSALRGGIAAARGKYLLMGDADGSYDFGHLDRFVAKLREGYELVMGNRFAGGIAAGAMPWKNRFIGNPLLSLLGRVFFGGAVHDYHCGLRAFTAEAVRRLDLRTTGMEFASEMVIKGQLNRLRIAEVPTVLRPDTRGRPPHLRPWRDGWRHLRFMLLFSPRWLFLLPGLLLIAVGSGVGARLVAGPWEIKNGVTLDVHTLLFCAVGIVLGFQSVSFAVLTKAFAHRHGLRPPDSRFDRVARYVTLESGLLAGVLFVLGGIALAAWAVWFWSQRNFGELDPRSVLRWLIPAATLLALGGQIVLASFLLGVFRLSVRPPEGGGGR